MNDHVVIGLSSRDDGSMSHGVTNTTRLNNRTEFLSTLGISPEDTVLVRLRYEGNDYTRYHTVDTAQAGDGILRPSSITADALYTRTKRLALLLPVADCIAAVAYDPDHEVMGMAHLGRHNLVQKGGTALTQFMHREFGTVASNLLVWLSPAAGKTNYPLYDFDHQSLHEVATAQFMAAGVRRSNITIDTRDTTRDERLFSHSQYLRGNQAIDGRQACVAFMR